MSKNNSKFNTEIAFYAFRYALGRSSYAPSLVQNYILENIEEFSNNDLEKMCSEIDEAHHLGMKIDLIGWHDFRSKLKSNLK